MLAERLPLSLFHVNGLFPLELSPLLIPYDAGSSFAIQTSNQYFLGRISLASGQCWFVVERSWLQILVRRPVFTEALRGLCQELANHATSPHSLGHDLFVSYPSHLILFINLPTLEATDSFVKFLLNTTTLTRICSEDLVSSLNVPVYVRDRNLSDTCLAILLDCQNSINHTAGRYVQLYD